MQAALLILGINGRIYAAQRNVSAEKNETDLP